MDIVFKALADKTRRSLLDQLYRRNGQTLNDLCSHLDMTRQAVSKHLIILESAGLITVMRKGREKRHYLNAAPIADIYERWISKYDRHRIEAVNELKKTLEEDNNE